MNYIGLHAYRESQRPELAAVPWHSLLCALMRGADSNHATILRSAFPDEWRELQARYDAPGGRIGAETLVEL